jgi:hypothetical protein
MSSGYHCMEFSERQKKGSEIRRTEEKLLRERRRGRK